MVLLSAALIWKCRFTWQFKQHVSASAHANVGPLLIRQPVTRDLIPAACSVHNLLAIVYTDVVVKILFQT